MAQLKSGSTVGGSGIVTKNDNQALHDTDALRISGSTLYLYKGDGGSESVTVTSPVPSLQQVLNNTSLAAGSETYEWGTTFTAYPTSNNVSMYSPTYTWQLKAGTYQIRLRFVHGGSYNKYDPYGWIEVNGSSICYARATMNNPGTSTYSGYATVTLSPGSTIRFRGTAERTYIQPNLRLQIRLLNAGEATIFQNYALL